MSLCDHCVLMLSTHITAGVGVVGAFYTHTAASAAAGCLASSSDGGFPCKSQISKYISSVKSGTNMDKSSSIMLCRRLGFRPPRAMDVNFCVYFKSDAISVVSNTK